MEAGTYRLPSSGWNIADLTVTIPAGWAVQYGHVFQKHPDQPTEISFYPVLVDAIFADSCEGDRGRLMEVGDDGDLAEALLLQGGSLATVGPDTPLAGLATQRIDLAIPEGTSLDGCSLAPHGLQIWYSNSADKYFVLLPDGTAHVYIVDLDGGRQVFLTQYRASTPAGDIQELESILNSIAIASSATE